MNNKRVRLIIKGRVQGVWFRDSTRRQASRLGVRGWVRNLPDGSVEVLAEGPAQKVDKLVEWCHEGPPAAHVDQVIQDQEAWRGEFDSFEIRY